MKQKQIIISLLALVLFSICLCSCSNDVAANTSQKEKNQQNSIAQSDEKYKKAVTDSINNLREKVMELTEKLEDVSRKSSKVETVVADLKKKIDDEKTTNKKSILIGGVIGLLSLIVSIFALIKVERCSDRLNRYCEDIESLKKRLNEQNVTGTKRPNYATSSLTSNNEILDLSRRIQYLENELSKIKRTIPVHVTPTSSTSYTPPIKPTKISYFGTAISGENGTGYFKKVFESKDSDARFLAEITDGSAEFEPIVSLSTIKSSDYMDLAVKFEGVSKNEAMNMSVHHKGLAQQIGDKWIIKEEAVIMLTK